MDIAPNLTPVLGRYFERTWSHGQGHRLFDTDGKAYLDFANGIAVTALGHGHPRVNAAIHAQVDRLLGPINAVGYAEPVSQLATELAATFPAPLDSVFFLNSGAEAIDAALKLARRVTGRPGIIAFRGGFHGRTFGATSVTTSNLNYRTGYEPLLPGVYFAPYPSAYRDFGGDEAACADHVTGPRIDEAHQPDDEEEHGPAAGPQVDVEAGAGLRKKREPDHHHGRADEHLAIDPRPGRGLCHHCVHLPLPYAESLGATPADRRTHSPGR